MKYAQKQALSVENVKAVAAFGEFEEKILATPAHRMAGEDFGVYQKRRALKQRIEELRRLHGYSNPAERLFLTEVPVGRN
jgi:hypothetical protein